MSYPEPRRVVLALSDLRRLTILERARACAVAGVPEQRIGPLLHAVSSRNGTPEELETGVTLLYAIAHQLERRLDPGFTWEAAQALDLALDLGEATADPVAEAEAHASVAAAIGTGLPPAIAGELTLAQVDAYRSIRAEQAKGARGGRRGYRRHR